MKLQLIKPTVEEAQIVFDTQVQACILSGMGGLTIAVLPQQLKRLEILEELLHIDDTYDVVIRPTEFKHYNSAVGLEEGWYMVVQPKTPPVEGLTVLRCI